MKGPARVVRLSSRRYFGEVAGDDGSGFGPANEDAAEHGEADQRAKDDYGGENHRADEIDVGHGIESDATLKAGGLIPKARSHPGMGTLMKTEREDEQDELEDRNCKLGRLQRMLPDSESSG